MAEYIEREDLIRRLELSIKSWGRDCNSNAPVMVRAYEDILHKIKNLPTADVVKVVRGEWKDNYNGTFTCSVCGGKSSRMNYCGHCGANMNDNIVKCKDCKHWRYFADEKRCFCVLTNNYTFRNYCCVSGELKELGK